MPKGIQLQHYKDLENILFDSNSIGVNGVE